MAPDDVDGASENFFCVGVTVSVAERVAVLWISAGDDDDDAEPAVVARAEKLVTAFTVSEMVGLQPVGEAPMPATIFGFSQIGTFGSANRFI